MFTRFSNPLHQLAQNSKHEGAHDKTENYRKVLKNVVYAGLLTSGFLLSGYNFVNDRIVKPVANEVGKEDTIGGKMNMPTISVVSYVHFDTRENLHNNRHLEPVVVEAPHLKDDQQFGNIVNAGAIRGYVTDSKGRKVKSADVLLYKADELVAVTYTGLNGEFVFPVVASSKYKLKILRTGFLELNYPEFEVFANATSFMDIGIVTIDTPYEVRNQNAGTSKKENKVFAETEGSDFALTIIIKNTIPDKQP